MWESPLWNKGSQAEICDPHVHLRPEPPFIWPELRILESMTSCHEQPPFTAVAMASDAVFGIIASLSGEGIGTLDAWLRNNGSMRCVLIVAVYPTCMTREHDIDRVQRMAEQFGERLMVRVYACRMVTDRPTNGLCFWNKESGTATLATGPTENLGFDTGDKKSRINFVFKADSALVESFRRYFDWLWVKSGALSNEITKIPDLVLPKGTEEGARLWREYCETCSASSLGEAGKDPVVVNPETGEVSTTQAEGEAISSPTEDIGIPKLDPLAIEIARLFDQGSLVTIEKGNRVPPLEAPVRPEWFGIDSFRQTL